MSKNKGRKDQQWFDEKYSEGKAIVITGGRRLNFTGSLKIERFNNLESINLKKLKIAYLEISKCSQLNITNLSELTKLTSLSVSGCPKLITLNCLSNGLTSLELSGCYRLNNIDLSKFTKLQSLYLRGYQNLTTLDCSSTEKLISLKISDCVQLIKITNLPKSSKLQSLFVIDCPKLTTLDYSTNALTSLEISGCTKLKDIISLSKAPKLTSLSIIDCPNITKLDCSSNERLTELEVSDLTKLNCSNTSIKILSVNLCPNLETLDCSNNNKLVNLDISNCSKLEFLDCSNSKLPSLDINNCKFLLKEYEQDSIKSKMFKYPPDLKIIEKRITKNLIIVGRTGGGKSTLSNVITESDVFEEITFKNKDKCEADKKQLHNENENIANIVRSCRDVIYVDNPPTNIQIIDEEDEETIRKPIAEYLESNCEDVPPELEKNKEVETLIKITESFCTIT
ncbi:leucine-rich repeat domain-containing protein [Rhizophagus irregularis DAOM 181602=DAOM 197198]|nr:leucine-rich repeat domain-containing protein [Rhizophagus irregularis DAOM 181602=DAOM 197198]